VSDSVETSAASICASDAEMGKEAARLIWEDAPSLDEIHDPRTGEFAAAVIDGLAAEVASSPGVIKRMMRVASQAAANLNVAQFQGLVEVIQNADDVCAEEVRFMLRKKNSKSQLLVVHDGQPVTCQHVLGMALPFLTTKTHRVDQRGRFGIGLKTLGRLAGAIAIHSAPYHFSGDHLSLKRVEQEPDLPNFYSPATDTLLVLDLNDHFSEEDLRSWFEAWEEDGLIFLGSVRRFRWCAAKGKALFDRAVEKSDWEPAAFEPLHEPVVAIRHRYVRGQNREWRVWNATVSVPAHLKPAHKARREHTEISVAVPDEPSRGSLYIGFKTRVPVALNLSLDAHFDPSTAREGLIENNWNNWLVDRCTDLLADVAAGLLIHEPGTAWKLVPLQREKVGDEADRWLRGQFDAAFERVRKEVGTSGLIAVGQEHVRLSDLAFEDESLDGLLAAADIEALIRESRALPADVRDGRGRWREVLQELEVATKVGTAELLDGFTRGLFAGKDPVWWVEAAQLLTANHPADDELFGVPYWLSDDGRPVPCQREGDTARPLVVGHAISAFSARWKLLDRLHEAYGRSTSGKQAIEWLGKHAAFTAHIEAATELAAFAERFADEPADIGDEDLRAIRDRFDEIPERSAAGIGPGVGAALLLDGYVYRGGKPQKRKVSPVNAYLCRTLDSDNPNWPTAAGKISDIEWVAASYNIASLFSADIKRNIEAEWCVSWQESKEVITEGIRLASDEELNEALEEQADKINTAPKVRIELDTPARRSPASKPRTLKESVGVIAGAKVSPGSSPKPAQPVGRRPLSTTAPEASLPSSPQSSRFVTYTNADLEQRGWELLKQVLNTSQDARLVDFRRRHGVGADGAINWKTFVELKATGRSPQSSIEMSNSEYARAKERGKDFILALVSGLEVGQLDEVRLIIDPANCVSTRPVNGIHLVGLLVAPAVVVQFEEVATKTSTER